jgi:hypothetical protein
VKQYCYVIVNNAGHSWAALSVPDPNASSESSASVLPQLLQEGWVPIRETPMGGGTSPLAHSLVLLEKGDKPKVGRPAKRK